jgi:DNA helicase-2/ATP-dependent DNA helicase PcrA
VPSETWFERRKCLIESANDVSHYKALRIRPNVEHRVRRPYSITADILAFRRCSRQYGFFAVRGYVPAQATQLYFGIVIHEVLDRAHRQYRGLIEGKPARVPTDDEIQEYHRVVTEALRARGIRPYSRKAEESAKEYLKRFNSQYGPNLYPRVRDTEHKLRADMKDFYLHGVVDVLARSEDDSKPGQMEIWDYKGSHKVPAGSEEMENYEFQMRVYAELYRRKNGEYPARAILCFLGEESLQEMVVEVRFDSKSTAEAMRTFTDTVKKIEHRREVDDWSPPPKMPSRETCGACDIRWDCSTAKSEFPMRYP